MSNRTYIVILVQVLGTCFVDVTLYLAAEERMTPSGSGSPRVYAELTGVGPITTVQTPISHHPFVPMYPQCESYSVCSSIPSCIHHQSITMLFQSTLLGNNRWVLCPWGGTMGTCVEPREKRLLVPVSQFYVYCRSRLALLAYACWLHEFHRFLIVIVVAM